MWTLANLYGNVVVALFCKVDDVLATSIQASLVVSLIAHISSWWPCTVQVVDRILCIELATDVTAGTLTMQKEPCTLSMVRRYAYVDVHTIVMPLPSSLHFAKHGQEMGGLLLGVHL